MRSIRKLPKILDHDLLDYLGLGDYDYWCSTQTHLIHSAILVEVIQERFVHPTVFENIGKIADPWPCFWSWERTVAKNLVETL